MNKKEDGAKLTRTKSLKDDKEKNEYILTRSNQYSAQNVKR